MKKDKTYLAETHGALPRLLSLFDRDPHSPTRGYGDRRFWGWKLVDFPNGTYQGAAHGLARLLAADLLPEGMDPARILARIKDMAGAAERMTRGDGSLEEAFPHEGSFCVTALVAHDLLVARDLLGERLDPEGRALLLRAVRPMIGLLRREDEGHAFISNHLATAAAALYLWADQNGGEGEDRGFFFLDRVLKAQSAEGWFPEYGGADPGYQTLALHYLAGLHLKRPDLGLGEPLARACRFLSHFAHPDGSFGGLYGSRNTRIPYPGGLRALAREIPEAASLDRFVEESAAARRTVGLSAVDEPNLIPLFNSYAWAAVLPPVRSSAGLPCEGGQTWRKDFREAGLVVDKGPGHYSVVSWKKGGVLAHFARGKSPRIDPGVLVRDSRGREFSSQAHREDNRTELSRQSLVITAPMARVSRLGPSPFRFLVLRALNLTLMRFRPFREGIKKILVGLLITGSRKTGVTHRREIHLGEDLSVTDTLSGSAAWAEAGLDQAEAPFSVIHMASQGYWQVQDDEV